MNLADRYGQWAVVLGASEGLGAAWARALSQRGMAVVLCARRLDKLQSIAAELATETRVVTLDLSRPDLEQALAEATGDLDVGLVVYNAGHSVIAEFLETSIDDKLAMVDINVRGPLVTAHHFGCRMAAKERGAIVLMSSLSGFQGTAMVSTYAATKAFDTVLGEALWEELGRRGVDVLVCAAGAILTPNFTRQTPDDRIAGVYPMKPEDVVAQALDALGSGAPTVIPGRMNRLVRSAMALLPRGRAVSFFSRNTRALYEDRR